MKTSRARTIAVGLLGAACALALAGCGSLSVLAGSAPPSPVPVPARSATESTTVRYMPLGDSITEGTPVPGGFRTALWLQTVKQDGDKLDFVGSRSGGPAELGDKDHEGHPGWCIDGPCGGTGDDRIYPHLHEWITTFHPDVVSIHLGTNDLKLGASGTVVAYRLDEAIGQIYRDDPGAHLLVAKIIPMRDVKKPWAEYNSLIPQIVQRYHDEGREIEVVDLSTVVEAPADFADFLHPNEQGYLKMADALRPALSEAYAAAR